MKISGNGKAQLFEDLGTFRDSFREYAVSLLKEHFGQRWTDEVQSINRFQRDAQRGGFDKNVPVEKLLDFGQFKSFALRHRDFLLSTVGHKAHNLPTWLDDITETRNKLAHFDELDEDEVTRARINMRQIAKLLGITELEKALSEKRPLPIPPRQLRRSDLDTQNDPLIEVEVAGILC